jgi:hypothetical protein
VQGRTGVSCRAQIVALNVMLEQQRCHFSDQEMVATVIINAKTGQIVEWAPAATMLLHWTQRERMGKIHLRSDPRTLPAATVNSHAGDDLLWQSPTEGPV